MPNKLLKEARARLFRGACDHSLSLHDSTLQLKTTFDLGVKGDVQIVSPQRGRRSCGSITISSRPWIFQPCRTKIPKRNPRATLSYYSCQIVNGNQKNLLFFWGYRTHALVAKEGICLVELTLPNNITDQQVAFKLIKALKRQYGVKKGSLFLADKAYDVKELYDFIVHELKSKAYIPINPRNTKDDKTLGPHGCPICEAGVEMKSVGRFKEGKRERIKFRCPLKASKKVAKKHNHACPANHPSFDTGKCYGCTKYLDVTNDARSMVPRDSLEYQKTFKGRQVVEQYFARLGDREVEQTTHYSLTSVKNQMTIAHLTASLIAVAAATLLDRSDKIRCYRTFAQLPKTG